MEGSEKDCKLGSIFPDFFDFSFTENQEVHPDPHEIVGATRVHLRNSGTTDHLLANDYMIKEDLISKELDKYSY